MEISPFLTFPTMPNFLPDGYETPKSISFYTKFEDGEKTKLRILPSGLEDRNCITWYEYFEEHEDWKKSPIRSIQSMKNIEEKHFWAFKVYNHNLWIVQLCTIKQKSLMKALEWIFTNEDYGDPLGYDITISRVGKGLDTEYSLVPSPPKKLDKEFEDKKINWNNWLNSEDPLSEEELWLPSF